jgi:hypothetical protein
VSGGIPAPKSYGVFWGGKLDDLELFEDITAMERVARHLDDAGYVDNQIFCMVRSANSFSSANDRRLVFERALFLGGSIIPGDDVFLAVHPGREDADPELLVFDWEMPVPNRWVARGTLQGLIDELARFFSAAPVLDRIDPAVGGLV